MSVAEREEEGESESRCGKRQGGEFVYRPGERRERQSVRGATLDALHLVAAVRDARAVG